MNLNPIFAEPILETKLDIKPEWIEFIKNIDYKRNKLNNGYVSKNYEVLEEEQLKSLKENINNVIKKYTEDYLKISNKFKITCSWVMKHIKNDYAQPHLHKNSIISGIFYLQAKQGSGDLVFTRTNFLSDTFSFDRINDNIINTHNVMFKVYDGLLLVFPSRIKHGTFKMPFDNYERICLSFNTFITNQIGCDDTKIDFKEN